MRVTAHVSGVRAPIRVCHLTSVHRVNDVRIFHKECETLAAAGFEVTLIGIDAAVRSDRVKIRSIDPVGGRLSRMILQSNEAFRIALSENADVFHFHDPELLPYGLLLKKRTGAKVIFDSHECFREDIVEKTWIPRWLRTPTGLAVGAVEDVVVSRIDQVIAATPHIGNYFKRRAKRTVVVNNYPLSCEFGSLPDLAHARGGICYAGAMSPARGLIPFLDALSFIPQGCPVHVAGPFSSLAFEQQMRSHPNWPRVTYHGVVDRADLAKIYATCLAGVVTFLPAPNHIHSQPNKLFEYMSAGLAVIGSNFPLWQEVLADGDAGICVNPASSAQIASAINRVIADPGAAREMGRRGRELTRRTYNWESQGRRLVNSYNELLTS